MRKLFTLLIAMLLWAGSSWAQVNLYTFVSSAGTYTPLSTETVLWSATFDDNNSVAITIPSFTVAGTAYTTMFVQANGWITLGGTSISSSYTPISQSTAYPVVISACGRDLNNAATGTPKISYNTNDGGDIVVQYQDVRRYYITGEILSFQIRLIPSTGNIKFVYGGTITGGTSTDYPQVGLRGATNTVFTNRSTATDWAATTAGGLNTATCLMSTTVMPSAGLTYTFTPPAAGTPEPPTTPSPADAAINVPVNGSVTWTFGANTTTYDLKFGPTGSMTEVVTGASAGATGSYAYSSLANGAGYQWQVIEHNGALTTSGPVWSFFTVCAPYTAISQNFDAVTIPNLPVCWSKLTTYTYSTVTTITGTYNSAPNCAKLYQEGALTTDKVLLISPQLSNLSSGTYQLSFFAKSSSVAVTTLIVGTMADPANAATFTPFSTVTINSTAFTQSTVSFASYAGADTYIAFRHPMTSTYSNVYIDDVIWEPLPACPKPTALTTTNITGTTADLNWTNGGTETLWQVKYGAPGFDPLTGGTLITGITSHPYTLNPPLTPNTPYDWYVSADCGGDEVSAWSVKATFTTLCGSTTVPFTENFDSYTPPAVGCGTILDVNADNIKWASSAGSAYNGANKLHIGYSAAGVNMNDWYFTQGLVLTAGQSYDVKFYYKGGSSTYLESLEVKWGDAPTVAGMTSSAIFSDVSFYKAVYTLGAGSFTPATSGTYYVGWHCFSIPDRLSIDVDQITVVATPTAPSFVFVPETTIACGYGPNGGYSAEQTYTIAGLNLTGFPGNILVTAPANFQVSLTTGAGFGPTVDVPYTGATLAATTIYVRCAPTAPATDYSGNITHVGGGASGDVAVTGTSILTYCPSYATSPDDEDIFNVTIGTLNNTSDCSTLAPGPGSLLNEYSNYTTSVAAPTLQQAVAYPFSLTSGTCGGNWGNCFKVFIDFNQNGVFTDAGEEVYVSAAATAGPHTETGNITIPAGASLGSTWMRVICRETSTPSLIAACGTYSWGETEDYLVNIAEATTGTLQGFVTDFINEEAVIGATVSFGAYSTITNGLGFYQFATVPVGTYDVTCTATGFQPQTATGITVTLNGTTNQAFILDYQLDPPVGLAATLQNNVDVHLTWQAPGTPAEQWLHWDDGVNYTAIGLNSASTWSVAIRFPVSDIGAFNGLYLQKIKFFPMLAEDTYTLKVWQGANAGTEIASQLVPSPTVGAWNEITLNTPVVIDGTQELWIGYEIYQATASTYPAGADVGPYVVGKGDWAYFNSTWQELGPLGLNYNWNIQGFAGWSAGPGPLTPIVIEPKPAVMPVNAYGDVKLASAAGTTQFDQTASLAASIQVKSWAQGQTKQIDPVLTDAPLSTWTVLGYNIYRDGTKLNPTPVADLFYDNTGVAPGTYDYTVDAVYEQGLSAPAGPVSVTINDCFAPSLLIASAITSSGATFTWTPAPTAPTEWIVEYGPAGFAHGAGTSVPVSGTASLEVTTLSPGLTYDVYVRTDCGGASQSVWVGPVTFVTHIECPGGSVAETEACGDNTNGGCNMDPPAWEPLACGETVCGTAWCNGTNRDTDWFTFTLTEPTNVTFSGQAEFPFLLGLIDGRNGCPVGGFMVSITGTANQTKSVTKALGAGTYYAFMAPSSFTTIITCGGYDAYHVTLTCNTDCVQPVDLGVQNVTLTSADLFWSSSALLKNLEWGPGTFVQGAGANQVPGLAANTYTIPTVPGSTYTFYVQSVCDVTPSAWSGPFTFTVQCPATLAPITEDFELATFPPTCWSKTTGPPTWTRSTAASGYGIGSASAFANFYSISSATPFDLMTLPFDASALISPTLKFDYAYATYTGGEVDEMDVYYSIDGGLTYTLLLAMPGGEFGILNTGGALGGGFIPLSNEWATQTLPLPAGTNMILFEAISAWGNNLYLDNVRVEGTCPVPTALAATGITANAALLNWTENGLASTWDIEYGAAGFAHGSGTIVPVASKPHLLSGLTDNTTYDVYVRANCGAMTSDWSVVHQFTTLCNAIVAFPYTENFDAVTIPALAPCWTKYSSVEGQPWVSADETTALVAPKSAPNMMFVSYDNVNYSAPKDEWLVTPVCQLTAGTTYQVKFWVKAPGYLGSPEQMKLVATTDPSLSGVIAGTVLWDGNDLELADYTEFVAQFTPLTSDKYYFAWHAYTATVADYIALDDVSIEVAPAEPLTLDATVTNESCAYMSDGSIVTTVTGGVAPYGYLWNTLETTSSLTNLSEGTYSVTVTDFASSVITGSWTVTAPSEMSVTGTYHNSCFGANNGSAELTAVSGVAPYNYLWSTGASTAAISNLAPGFYSYTVTDATICNEVRGMMNIMEVPETVLSATTISASCPTAADGSIDLTATGVSPFTYLWSNGANTQDIAGLLPGNYSVTVTNAEGCAQTGTYTVDVISAICNDLAVTGEVTGTECFNAYNNIVVAGGVSLFTVKSTGTATFIAGNKINFMPGTKVELNGHLIGKIYNGSWCPGKAPAMPAVVTGQEETAFGFEQANFTLYPNPTNGNFTLVQKGEKTFGTVKLEIYSMGGERVLTDKMVGEKKHEFRFSDVPAGLYFVKVVADDYVETIKLIKTR